MHSIREIFIVGHGPSSSHTMGPANAVKYILNKYKDINNVDVILYGSLAETGKGHLTDYIIDKKLDGISHTITFDYESKVKHPNTLKFIITTKEKKYEETIISIGGGSIVTKDNDIPVEETYPHQYMSDILEYCDKNNLSLSDYVLKFEKPDIQDYLKSCFNAMMDASIRGTSADGYLPGPLHIKRKARSMFLEQKKQKETKGYVDKGLIMATASIASSEENACGGVVCIAPTCGSCGVIPGVLAYLESKQIPLEEIDKGMLVAGLVGIICKTNATVAGAEAGCQAEIGVACCMGAALIATALKMDNHKVAQAAEIALEHSLGLTCDPLGGYVQIPCIERNAMFAMKARDAVKIASLISSDYGKITLDDAIKTMYKTGKDLQSGYRETSRKGLAELFDEKKS